MTELAIYIIIPTHNRNERLAMLLSSLTKADIPPALKKILVVENGSEVSQTLVTSYADRLPIEYLHVALGNKSNALNTVLKQVPADAFLLFFDDDIRIDSNVLLRFATVAGDLGFGHYFGGGLRADYETVPAPELIPYLPYSAKNFLPDIKEGAKVHEAYRYFLGANWGCFHQDLIKAGGFSNNYGPGSKSGARGQETDAQRRLYNAGCRPVSIANAVVDHWVPEKVISEKWILDRIFNSSIQHGRDQPNLRKTIAFSLKLMIESLKITVGNQSFPPKFRIANALGYFKGLIER